MIRIMGWDRIIRLRDTSASPAVVGAVHHGGCRFIALQSLHFISGLSGLLSIPIIPQKTHGVGAVAVVMGEVAVVAGQERVRF